MASLHKRITILQGEYVQNFERARSRFFASIMFFTLAFVIISFRLVYLMGPGIISVADSAMLPPANIAPAPKRQNIIDDQGILLATSLKTQSLYADPKFIGNAENIAEQLLNIFPDLNRSTLTERLSNRQRRFVWIKRHITPRQHAAILEIGDPGLNVETEYRRVYPQGSLTAHILGYTNIDGLGIAGIEKTYNDRLIKDEKPLQLTLNIALQDVLRREMQKSITTFNAIGGAGIVMDVKTGAVKAMVSLPDFDPHHYNRADQNAMFNRNTVGVYEMGSTFKTFTVAAALEHKSTHLNKVYDVKKPMKHGRFTINDYRPFKRDITMTEAFIHSSNIATAEMALELGTDNLTDFYKDLGFFARAPIDLPERGAPLVPQRWREINTITASYGHGIAVSPLHLVRAFSAMVNGGTLPSPHFVKQTRNRSTMLPEVSVLSPETSALVSGLLALTVEKGTGSNAAHPDMWVGGKTGTSEKIDGTRGYNRKKLLSSFVSVFPADNPRYAILVIIDEPKGHAGSFGYATGGWTSAPVVGKVIAHMKSTDPTLFSIQKNRFPALESLKTYLKEDGS